MDYWEADKFNKLKDSIPGFGYHVFYPEKQETKNIFGNISPHLCLVAATTGTSLQMQKYICEGVTAQPGEPSVIIIRTKYDDTHHNKKPVHLNNYFSVVIPTTKGVILEIPLRDKFGQHLVIVDSSDMKNVLKDLLPPNQVGPIEEFYSKPRFPIVNIELPKMRT